MGMLERDHGKGVCTLEENKDDKIVVRSVTDDEVESNESCLLNLPSHVLEMIAELCVGVEYMYFCATCKRCHLGAPLIQWSNKKVSIEEIAQVFGSFTMANVCRSEAEHHYLYKSNVW